MQLLPNDGESFRIRGMARLYSQQFSEALEDFDHYFQCRNPIHSAIVHYLRGRAHETLGDMDQAIYDYTDAIYGWPQWPAPYRARAELYERVGKPKKALADCEEAKWRAEKHGEGPSLP